MEERCHIKRSSLTDDPFAQRIQGSVGIQQLGILIDVQVLHEPVWEDTMDVILTHSPRNRFLVECPNFAGRGLCATVKVLRSEFGDEDRCVGVE
jgi:hypothetical protein